MKALTAILLASGMAVTMIPSVAIAQDSTSTSIKAMTSVDLSVDSATMDEVANANSAVAVHVGADFDTSSQSNDIDELRAALDANVTLSAWLESEDMSSGDVVGASANGEGSLLLFVTTEADEGDFTADLSGDGSLIIDSDTDGDIDDETSVDADVGADVDAGVDLGVEGSSDDDEADADVNGEADVDAGVDVGLGLGSDDDDGIDLDLGTDLNLGVSAEGSSN